jgi:hypothetical protein
VRSLQGLCGHYRDCAVTTGTVWSLQRLCDHYRDCAVTTGTEITTGTVRSLQGLCGHYRDCAVTTGTVRSLQRLCDHYRDCAITTGTVRSLQGLCGHYRDCEHCPAECKHGLKRLTLWTPVLGASFQIASNSLNRHSSSQLLSGPSSTRNPMSYSQTEANTLHSTIRSSLFTLSIRRIRLRQ